ncbi:hypothetical protein AAFC00_006785 [Neodothiora populina]|uniref:Palmitoyltransferase n=1 Tax=Neodothiora populina TaxID=2781224 RepID=A0ABR3PB48_9PEZI
MLAFRNTVIAVLVISFFTFVALFGKLPALRNTPIGVLQRLLCLNIPATFRRLDTTFTGGRTSRALAGIGHYLFNQKNPVVLAIFLTLLTGSAYLFLTAAWPLLTWSQTLPLPFLLGAPYYFTYLCVTTRADHITPQNHTRHLHSYPYDHLLFRPDHKCRTCGFVKPARSKHCSLCGVCVAKADHHCPWVNNCLGRNNYRWFLALLLSLAAIEFYGAYLAWKVLSQSWTDLDSALGWTSRLYWSQWGNGFVRAINTGGLSVAGVGLLAVTTAPLPLGLLVYHIYLIWAGMTTNESSKWADWKDDMADGYVYRAKRSVIVGKEKERKRQNSLGQGDAKAILPKGECEEDPPCCRWPVPNDQMIVRTTDGNPPIGQEDLWEKVRSLDDIVNVYDLGVFRNFVCILQGR